MANLDPDVKSCLIRVIQDKGNEVTMDKVRQHIQNLPDNPRASKIQRHRLIEIRGLNVPY